MQDEERSSREKESNGRLSRAKWSEVEWRSWRPVISARFMLFRVFASGSARKKREEEEEMAMASQYKYA